MPELPDIVVYVEHLERRIVGATLDQVRVASPNLLRTFDPPLDAVDGRRVIGLRRIGKRIVLVLDGGQGRARDVHVLDRHADADRAEPEETRIVGYRGCWGETGRRRSKS